MVLERGLIEAQIEALKTSAGFTTNYILGDLEGKVRCNQVAVCNVDYVKDDVTHINGQGSGTLLTNDGYILTAFHCVGNYISEWNRLASSAPTDSSELIKWIDKSKEEFVIFNLHGERFSVDFSNYKLDPEHDLALIKANTFQKPFSSGAVLGRQSLASIEKISIHGIVGPGIQSFYSEGKIIVPSYDYEVGFSRGKKIPPIVFRDGFVTNAYAQPMVSGGALINSEGKIIGVASATTDGYIVDSVTGKEVYNGQLTFAAKSGHATTLISRKIHELESLVGSGV